jgi:hypothetical protein
MINVVLKLAFIDDVVNFFSNTLNSAVKTDLTNDELIVFALAKLETLIDRLIGISNDILQSQWTKFTPLLLDCSESNSSGVFLERLHIGLRVLHVRWHIRLVQVFLIESCLLWIHRRFVVLSVIRLRLFV